MATSTQQKQELFKTIWSIANDLRGAVDDFDYAKFSDEEAQYAKGQIVKEKGFFILPSELFCNVVAGAKNVRTSTRLWLASSRLSPMRMNSVLRSTKSLRRYDYR